MNALNAPGTEALRERHRREWDATQTLLEQALADHDMETAKLAKLVAETLKIRQEGERRAWGLDARTAPLDDGPLEVGWESA